MLEERVGFIGAGNMAQAIGIGLVNSGIIKASQMIVSATSERNFGTWKKLGVPTTLSNGEVVNKSDVIFLAMKPQFLDTALKSLSSLPAQGVTVKDKLFVSVIVGATLNTLNLKLNSVLGGVKPDEFNIVRVIPNTPVSVGAGCSVFCPSDCVNERQINTVKTLMSVGGLVEMVPESIMNAVGALSGSGPAYTYLIIEALSDGAVKMGVPRALAIRLAAQTLAGACKMVQETGRHPAQLRDEVCSPGGTTIAGIHALEQSGVRCGLMNAIEAATRRSEEIAKKQ